MNWKTFVKDYLTFSKRDRLGVVSLLVLAAAIYLLPQLFGNRNSLSALKEDTALLRAIDTVQKEKETFSKEEENTSFSFYERSKAAPYIEGALFTFDPNTLPTEGWQQLGLNSRTIKTINNYRSKGGRFYKREDLKKIWGLPEGFYNHVADYIIIEIARPDYEKEATYTYTPSKGKRSISAVQVNEADTAALIALPGIGSKLAARIINFRDKLGGFYATDQIGETYGLPDSTFQALKPYLQVNAAAVKKININTATKDELRTHPYVKWAVANAIVEYRTQHGHFKSIDDLKNIMLIDEALFNKIAPYVSL